MSFSGESSTQYIALVRVVDNCFSLPGILVFFRRNSFTLFNMVQMSVVNIPHRHGQLEDVSPAVGYYDWLGEEGKTQAGL